MLMFVTEVFVIFLSPVALKITDITLENFVAVSGFYVTLKATLLSSLIITVITRIPDTFL